MGPIDMMTEDHGMGMGGMMQRNMMGSQDGGAWP
jgi:hypothetical protein